MAKDPAFLFYSSDFLTGISFMNFEERGKYITILCMMHQHGRLSEESICFAVASISPSLRQKFKVDENGLWYNERLEIETQKRNKWTESRRNNALKPKNKENISKDQKAYAKHMPKHKENENENRNKDIIEIDKYLFLINSLLGKKFRATEKVKSAFQARTKEGYTMDDFRQAIENARTDQFHIDNDLKYLDSMFFLRPDKLEKWRCAKSSLPPGKPAKDVKGTMSGAIAMGDNYFKKREAEIQESKKIAG